MKEGEHPTDEAGGGEGEAEEEGPLAQGSRDAEGSLHGANPIMVMGGVELRML